MLRHAAVVVSSLTVVMLVCTGCNLFQDEAHVTSDTSWSGDFNGRTVDGSGNRTVDLGGGDNPKCAVVQKKTANGFLTLKIGSDEKTTTAAFGVVSACN
jgi:hypothetical protein